MIPAYLPATRLHPVTKSDDTDLSGYGAKKIYIGGAGNLVVIPLNGSAAVTLPVVAGAVLEVCPKKIMAATTATGIVLLLD